MYRNLREKASKNSFFTYIDQLLRARAGDIAVADAVGEDGDVVAELGAGAGGVGDADVGL